MTSALRRVLSAASDCAADRTCDEAEPVSPAPRCTSVMLERDLRACPERHAGCCAQSPASPRPALPPPRRSSRRSPTSGRSCSLISLIAAHRVLRRRLDAGDLLTDLAGRLRGLLGQRLHFGGHHRKAAAGLASPRRLDRGVERQQIGLSGDCVDQFDHVADPRSSPRQFADAIIGLPRLLNRLVGHPRRCLNLTADLVDRRGQLLAGAEATDCTLVEASSEAAATAVVISWARSAVIRQRIRGGFPVRSQADDRVSTILPTAPSKCVGELDACPPCADAAAA